MPNLRVIYNNAADKATLSSSATASNLGAANLQKDIKSLVCRSAGKTLTITATFSSPQQISAAVLALTNFSTTATMDVQCYTNSGDSTPVLDTGAVLCCQGASPGAWAVGTGVNTFAYGGGNYARVWLGSVVTVSQVVITVTDTNNTAAYIECSRLILGSHWEPTVGADVQGTTLTMGDTSVNTRLDSGDLISYVGTKHRKQAINLPSIAATERLQLWNILWGNGMSRPIFVSLYPNNSDHDLEQAHMLYGKLVQQPVMQTPYFNHQSATIEIEEV